ncbi:MAG: 4Fe-4S binding protein [Bacteroidales bacterium]|nr:4Fe-4S binding protein [Bacteroidales bacterium]
MELQSLKLVCFSPTGTTKKVAQSIVKGLNIEKVHQYDITKPEGRGNIIEAGEEELLVVAVPVYMGRVPSLIIECLSNIKGKKTPTVCVVVYGNRTSGNALLELNDILTKTGCITIAGGAFIGEHSFSTAELPIAKSRPNVDDLRYATNFGNKIKEKLLSVSTIDEISNVKIPGKYPYGGVTELWSVDFIAVSNKCSNKGICSEVCPTGAINKEDTSIIDIEKCISCCACIKSCPENARTIKESKVKEAAIRLNSLFQEPKAPEVYY